MREIVIFQEKLGRGQFFRNMFMSRKKRQEAKLKEEQEMINEGKVKIEIEAPENTDDKHGRQR